MAIADLCGFSQAFEREITRARRDGYPLCAVCVDVERASEALVERVEHVLSCASRASDVAARASDGEFLVLLPETSAEGAAVLADRLCATLREALWTPDATRVRVGVAELSPEMEGSALLVAARAAAARRALS